LKIVNLLLLSTPLQFLEFCIARLNAGTLTIGGCIDTGTSSTIGDCSTSCMTGGIGIGRNKSLGSVCGNCSGGTIGLRLNS